MQKRITIGLLSALSLVTFGCSTAVTPPAHNNQPASNQPASNQPAVSKGPVVSSSERSSEPESVSSTEPASPPLAQPPVAKTTGSRQDRSWEAMGTASTGEPVTLTFDSIQVATRSLGLDKSPTYFFQYKIGRDYVYAVTACDGTFSTSQDGDRYSESRRPESAATQKMLDRVCRAWVRTATVFDPPSNVRMAPKGEVICAVQANQPITTYGQYEDWYYTNACGKLGLIHRSQIRFS